MPDLEPGLAELRSNLLKRNRELLKKHRGDRCFVLATGPSVKTQDLKGLQNESCIAVSNFFVHPDYAVVRPRYYCIPPRHEPLSEEAWQAWMDDLNAKIGSSRLLCGINDIGRNMARGRFRNNPPYFLDFSGNYQEVISKGIDLTRPIPGVQSVSIMALMIAMYMGFSEIYLLGCDHDWLLHMYESRHFYSESEHVFNRLMGRDCEWKDTDLEEQCRAYIVLWQQYKILRQLAKQSGITICNATEGGMLDLFPRVDLATALRQAHASKGVNASVPHKDPASPESKEDIVSAGRRAPSIGEPGGSLNERGERLYHSGDVEGAERLFRKALQVKSESCEAHNNLGVLYWEKGDAKSAVGHLSQAIQRNPQYIDAILNYVELRKQLAREKTDLNAMGAGDVLFRPWEIVTSSQLVDRPPWIQGAEQDVVLPGGKTIDGYLTWDLREYALVVALHERGIPLVCQYRHGIQAPNFDFPGGYLDQGEDPFAAAKRELLEETGLESTRWDHLGSLFLDDTRGKARAHLFLAHDARDKASPSPGETEEMMVTYHTWEQLLEMVDNKHLDSMPTVAALFMALRRAHPREGDLPTQGKRQGAKGGGGGA